MHTQLALPPWQILLTSLSVLMLEAVLVNLPLLYLTPRCTKHLKTETTALSMQYNVPEQELLRLIERASGIDDKKLAEAKAILEAKDFKVHTLKCHITACLLSPNLTAYIMDTTNHIMIIMQEHNNLFKVPKIFFEHTKLNMSLKKLDISSFSVEALNKIHQLKPGHKNNDEGDLGDADAEGEMDTKYRDANVGVVVRGGEGKQTQKGS
ncbi:hypothetical protein PAXRUDRAFT_778337 [Paxillus rubicundulus Ve08.2h10]|uniref:Uncharacterized protein n=1 Tax=Paxillus rubicundulus Ve08.2h10 TaxID=930991 RepID=A0A0D0DH46_9AGAM|nr:hypothetical protein PAXRUDRAFT_778337 [Paxillus rubicundulus Ve08.2h10]